MNIVTALLEYLDLVFLEGGGGHLPQMPHPGSAIATVPKTCDLLPKQPHSFICSLQSTSISLLKP